VAAFLHVQAVSVKPPVLLVSVSVSAPYTSTSGTAVTQKRLRTGAGPVGPDWNTTTSTHIRRVPGSRSASTFSGVIQWADHREARFWSWAGIHPLLIATRGCADHLGRTRLRPRGGDKPPPSVTVHLATRPFAVQPPAPRTHPPSVTRYRPVHGVRARKITQRDSVLLPAPRSQDRDAISFGNTAPQSRHPGSPVASAPPNRSASSLPTAQWFAPVFTLSICGRGESPRTPAPVAANCAQQRRTPVRHTGNGFWHQLPPMRMPAAHPNRD
jgi:hypothetical protein